jgi:hypothetical protein
VSTRKPWVIYACCVMALWIFMPEIRRLADWRIGGSVGTMLAVLPLASMMPCLVIKRKWMADLVSLVFLSMLAALTYACVVGILSGNGIEPVLYTFADFLLPMAFGLWISDRARTDTEGFAAVARISLGLIAISSVYGIFAYVTMPVWDANWLTTSNLVSFGIAAPFESRVWGTMNGPGVFATFVVFVLALNFAPVVKRTWLDASAVIITVIALALSLNRSAWVALAFAVIVYVVFSPLRVQMMRVLAVLSVVVVLVGGALLSNLGEGNAAVNSLVQRVQTLGDIGSDDSALDRSDQIAEAFDTGVHAPIGLGLGVYGTAAQLNSSSGDSTILDSGYLARFVELGWFGTLAMSVAFGIALVAGIGCVIFGKRVGLLEASLLCSLFAMQVAMMWFLVSGDLTRAGSGTLFWIASFMLVSAAERSRSAAPIAWGSGAPSGAH